MPFDLPTFTLLHVVLSLLGIVAGLVVVGGLMAGVRLDGWIGLFLVTTVLTNVTGFGFPFGVLLPSHIVGVVSLIILPVAIAARYWKQLLPQLAAGTPAHGELAAAVARAERKATGRAPLTDRAG